MPNPPGSALFKFQKIFQKLMSFSPPVIHGRGIFTYNYGVLPYRKQIVSVVGTPIDCPKVSDPSMEIILEYQQKYLLALTKLYDSYKDKYALDRKSSLNFIE
jgi:2-acylglycerol O-acyltransferase 2